MNDFSVIELVDTLPGATILADDQGCPVRFNGAARELLECELESIADLRLSGAGAESTVGGLLAKAARESKTVAFAGVPKNGSTGQITIVAKPVIRDGRVFAVLATAQKASKRMRLDQIRRDFVANVSHELKTPITGVRLLSEALAGSLKHTDGEASYLAGRLEKEAKRLSNLVEDLLDLSKLETGPSAKEAVNFATLVRDVSDQYTSTASDKGLAFETVIPQSCPPVWGDTEQLELLVSNLVDNAIRYTSAGSIRAEVSSAEQHVVLQVSDTGLGIPETDLPRIFERFYRVDKARSRKKGGTGLGLSIVKHVLTNHKGRIDVQSEVGAGSVFTVRLQCYEAR